MYLAFPYFTSNNLKAVNFGGVNVDDRLLQFGLGYFLVYMRSGQNIASCFEGQGAISRDCLIISVYADSTPSFSGFALCYEVCNGVRMQC